MNLIELSIKRPVFAWILMASLIIFGAISLNRLGVSQLPDVDFPVISISVNYEGAAPEVVEAELIDSIEQNLLSIEGIQQMRSTVRQGGGTVALDLDIERNVDVALQEVQTALGDLRLPAGVDPPLIRKRNTEESPVILLGVSTEKPMRETLKWVETYLLDQFRFLPGVGEVSIGGFSQRNLRVWPDPKKLKAAELTVIDLLDAIQTQHVESAAGIYADDKNEFRVRWMGEAGSPEEVSNIQILKRGGQIIQDKVYRIRDVASVEDGLSDIRRVVRIDGKNAVSISIQKQRGANEIKLAKMVRERVNSLQSKLPLEYGVRVNVDYSLPTEAGVETTYHKLIGAALVTILVCFLFLGSFQSAINILFSIPTSIVGTFLVLYFSHFTLNLFTLLALTLAVSIVVDDAIMLLENIVRHARMGKKPHEAAYAGAMEILPAATAATLAVVAVFLPVIFMEGITGRFFFQFGVTMSAAVLLSLLEAVTITPMRSAFILQRSSEPTQFEKKLEHFFQKLSSHYETALKKTLNVSSGVLILSACLFAVSLLVINHLKQEFVPSQDQNILQLSAQTPAGSSLQRTMEKSIEIESIIKAHPDLKAYVNSIGSGGFNTEVNQISFPLFLKPRQERSKGHLQIMEDLRTSLKAVKGIRLSIRDVSSRGLTTGRQFPVSFNLTGGDLTVLDEQSRKIIQRLEDEGLVQDMDTDLKTGMKELLIRPVREAMAARGVSIEAVARTLSATVAGVRQNRFTSEGRRYDIRVKFPDEQMRKRQDIQAIEVRNNFGLRVPLSQLVKFEETNSYQAISRVNRQRAVGVYGNVKAPYSQREVLKRAELMAKDILPEGYHFSLEGAAAGLQQSTQSMLFALALGILIAYMVLAVQFNSFLHPVAVLAALPFSLTGALLTLWMFGISLNLFSFVGLVVLMGIAKKNSIMLVEFTNQVRRREHASVSEALLKACPVRLRPILMTSVATVAAAIPLVVGNSIGQETRTPMGATIIGGTVLSTVFTLFVVPCLYERLSVWVSCFSDKRLPLSKK